MKMKTPYVSCRTFLFLAMVFSCAAPDRNTKVVVLEARQYNIGPLIGVRYKLLSPQLSHSPRIIPLMQLQRSFELANELIYRTNLRNSISLSDPTNASRSGASGYCSAEWDPKAGTGRVLYRSGPQLLRVLLVVKPSTNEVWLSNGP